MMKCGHRGRPSRMEEKRISRLLRKSGFIPMLEEIYKGKDRASKQASKNIEKDKDDINKDKIIMVTERTTPLQSREQRSSSSASKNRRVTQSPSNNLRSNINNTVTNELVSNPPSEDDRFSKGSKKGNLRAQVQSPSRGNSADR